VQREAGFDGGEPPRQLLPARTTIGVLLGIVDEILLAEPAVRPGAREVSGFGWMGVTPAASQARISSPLK
jgi:hypothetical protein